MRAAAYERTGPASEVLSIVELPIPIPGSGEVRVRVSWSGVNPSDVKNRSGVRSKTLPFPRIVPHSDGAGVIDDVGPDVPRERIGQQVWLWNAAWQRAYGTAAEYVVLPATQAVPLPKTLDASIGACLGIPALTAYHAVAVDGGVADKCVLIAGGAGAVGHYAIQFARQMGARQILATVSGPEKAAVAKAAGADIVLNYRTDDLVGTVQEITGGQGVERIVEVDLGANIDTDIALLQPGGDIVAYGSGATEIALSFPAMLTKGIRLRFFLVYKLSADDRSRTIAGVSAMLESDLLSHNIAARLPLAQIALAHEIVEQGHAVGNVILEIG